MCTVTFIARQRGYCLGMNRDEKLTRPEALPPTKTTVNGRVVLCPSEPSGGTWIALNDSGVCLALINWYSVNKWVECNAVSRGEVVKALGATDSVEAASVRLNQLLLERINPFRLIGIFPASSELVEWRWDVKRLVRKKHPWKTRQWVSSGFDEPGAQRVRGRTFRDALQHTSATRLSWLRKLHSSHAPHIGPFSMCMHRSDAATVSYTEIAVSTRTASMRYHAGTPCKGSSDGVVEGGHGPDRLIRRLAVDPLHD